jgi:hypothetical protein
MGRAAALVALLVIAAPAARADDESPRALNQRAVAAFALGQYGQAAELWEKVFEQKPQPALLYNAAQAHRLAGNKERALMLYLNYLRLYGREVANRAEVEQHVELLTKAIESDKRVATAPPTGVTPGERAARPRQKRDAEAPPGEKEPPGEASPPSSTVDLSAPAQASPPSVVSAAPERERAPSSRRGLWIGLGVAAGVVLVAAVVLGVVLGATSDPTPTRGAISFGGL